MSSSGGRLVQRAAGFYSRQVQQQSPRSIGAPLLVRAASSRGRPQHVLLLPPLQCRHYLFFPSDLSELRHRWNLFWEDRRNNRTKIKLRLQNRYQLEKSRIRDRYQTKKLQMKDYYQEEKSKMKDYYQEEKSKMKNYYREEKSKMKDYYQEGKSKMKDSYEVQRHKFQERRGEFTKRWKARRRDMLQDGKNYVKGYMYRRKLQRRLRTQTHTKIFTIEEYCQPDWFDPLDGRPLSSLDPTGRYVNPWMSWSTNGVHKVSDILKWRYQRAVKLWNERGIWSFFPKDLPQLLLGPTVVKDSQALEKSQYTTTAAAAAATTATTASNNNADVAWHAVGDESRPDESGTTTNHSTDIQFTWIGHSTCLVKMGNATLLTDPIFSHRCSPFQRLPGVGVPREVPPSMTIADLPSTIDICMISHDHYDHMDQQSIINLRDRVKHWVLPKGLPEWLETRCSVDPQKMVELEWWQSAHWTQQQQQHLNNINHSNAPWQLIQDSQIQDNIFHNNAHNANINTMTITCTPAQHWSSRTFFDRCKRLWCGFAVETRTHLPPHEHEEYDIHEHHTNEPVVQKFFFAGDTGMPRNGFPLFQQIGDFCARGRYHHSPRGSKEVAEAITKSHEPSIRNHSSIDDATSLALTSLHDDDDDDTDDHHDDALDATSTMSSPFHPFDLAALPIGAYEPGYLMQDAHMNPMEAVQCARQLQAKKSVAIHWGTFALSEEPMEEPPQKLQQALRETPEYNAMDFVTLPIGGTLQVPATTITFVDDDDHDHEDDVDDDVLLSDLESEELEQSLNAGK